MQTTSHLLMIRPVAFSFNEETAVNNSFQQASGEAAVNSKAREEFDHFVGLLEENDIDVTVVEDTAVPHTPDSVFPNNWASYHSDGQVVIYPMFAANRRSERDKEVIKKIGERFVIHATVDLTDYEKEGKFLEGTGSMVLDRENELAYACLSPRTDATVLYDFCEILGYTPILFHAKNEDGVDIYHTNVMMCIAEDYAILCRDAITGDSQQKTVTDKLTETNKEIIIITPEQMNYFAGNMLQVKNNQEERFLVMSTQAYDALTKEQLGKLEAHNRILHAPLNTIEQNGGGSARCMIAEIFLPLKSDAHLPGTV